MPPDQLGTGEYSLRENIESLPVVEDCDWEVGSQNGWDEYQDVYPRYL